MAPAPVKDSGSGAVPREARICSSGPERRQPPGMSGMQASAMPIRDRCRGLQPKAMRIKKLTEVSSRKSIVSANRDNEPVASATPNSTAK